MKTYHGLFVLVCFIFMCGCQDSNDTSESGPDESDVIVSSENPYQLSGELVLEDHSAVVENGLLVFKYTVYNKTGFELAIVNESDPRMFCTENDIVFLQKRLVENTNVLPKREIIQDGTREEIIFSISLPLVVFGTKSNEFELATVKPKGVLIVEVGYGKNIDTQMSVELKKWQNIMSISFDISECPIEYAEKELDLRLRDLQWIFARKKIGPSKWVDNANQTILESGENALPLLKRYVEKHYYLNDKELENIKYLIGILE